MFKHIHTIVIHNILLKFFLRDPIGTLCFILPLNLFHILTPVYRTVLFIKLVRVSGTHFLYKR